MDNVIESHGSNVIEVSFSKVRASKTEEEFNQHLNSLIEESDDPLTDLLEEFSDEEDTNSLTSNFDHLRLNYQNSLDTMGDKLLCQIQQIKDKTAKISYYLSEMNIDL